MARYRYRPLPKTSGAATIRVVTIHPGCGDIVISLQTESFTPHGHPQYEALSYVWGSRKSLNKIYVGTSDRATLRITRNLQIALKHLRYQDRNRLMWIDALCIDQSRKVEKGPQVALMGQIFECASRVVVWLGAEQNRSNIAMERLAYFGSQIDVDWGGLHKISPAAISKHVDHRIADPNSSLPMSTDQAIAVNHLLHRPWFDRLWIRQEIFVAEHRAVVCCGSFPLVEWSVFRKAIRLFYSKQPEPGKAVYFLRDRLNAIIGFIFQMRHTDLMSLRGSFDNALCSDPRDRIYGVRALLFKDQQDLCGTPDYTKSTVYVYSNIVRKYIETLPHGLTILRQCQLFERFPPWSGPSWVPDWSTKVNFQKRHNTFASSQLRGWHTFPSPRILRVLGVSRTTVQDIRSIPRLDPHDWGLGSAFLRSLVDSSSSNTPYPSGCTFIQAPSRTIVGGAIADFVYVQDGNYPTSRMAEETLKGILLGVPLKEEDYRVGTNAQRFFKRMDWGSSGNTFLWGSNGYIGVGPPTTKIGDEIFVIVGCQQPLILRRHPCRESGYFIVGECYVEGCARAEPLLGSLPNDIGLSVRAGKKWCFRDLRSSELINEDPRLEDLEVDLGEFRAQLAGDLQATLSVAPDVLLRRIAGLRYIDLV